MTLSKVIILGFGITKWIEPYTKKSMFFISVSVGENKFGVLTEENERKYYRNSAQNYYGGRAFSSEIEAKNCLKENFSNCIGKPFSVITKSEWSFENRQLVGTSEIVVSGIIIGEWYRPFNTNRPYFVMLIIGEEWGIHRASTRIMQSNFVSREEAKEQFLKFIGKPLTEVIDGNWSFKESKLIDLATGQVLETDTTLNKDIASSDRDSIIVY